MTTNLESLKAEYLAEFKRSIPRLKELAITLRAEDNSKETDTEDFWELTDDPKVNYKLYQVAENLSALDDFWASIPNGQSFPAGNETKEGDRLETLQNDSGLLMDKLFKLEALLTLIEGSMSDHEDRSAVSLAVELTQNALDFVDMKIDTPIRSLTR